MIIDPADTDPINNYKLLIGSITPRPIAFVSTLGPDGINNLAPFSFFTGVSANPPAIGFTPMINLDSRRRDSRINIEASGDFVVNVVSEEFADKMNRTAVDVDPQVDEFELAGLTAIASTKVSAPRLAEAHVSMECKLLQIVDISQKNLGGAFIIGEIVCFHVDDDMFDNFRIDPDKLRTIGRMGGNTYARTTDRFDLDRPTIPNSSTIKR